jgi:hypothetical protein
MFLKGDADPGAVASNDDLAGIVLGDGAPGQGAHQLLADRALLATPILAACYWFTWICPAISAPKGPG